MIAPREPFYTEQAQTLAILERKANGHAFGTFTAHDLMAMEFPAVNWVIPCLLPEGVTLLAGKPKLGKSWLALGFALAVGSGGVALGTKRVERGEALYLALEDNPRRGFRGVSASSWPATARRRACTYPRRGSGLTRAARRRSWRRGPGK